MNEAETRADHIDLALKAAGWVVEGAKVLCEHPITLGRLEGLGTLIDAGSPVRNNGVT